MMVNVNMKKLTVMMKLAVLKISVLLGNAFMLQTILYVMMKLTVPLIDV